MKSKNLLVVSSLAAAVAALAQSAYAAPPTLYVDNNNRLYIGGATATDPAIRNLLLTAGQICQTDGAPGTRDNNLATTDDIDVFVNNALTDVTGWTELAVTCRHI